MFFNRSRLTRFFQDLGLSIWNADLLKFFYAIFYDSRDVGFYIFRFLAVWDNSVTVFEKNFQIFILQKIIVRKV
jgi:hypothetical protein